VPQCCVFLSETGTSKLADQAGNIAPFTKPFYFLKGIINYPEVNLKLKIIDAKCNLLLKSQFAELPVVPTANNYGNIVAPASRELIENFAILCLMLCLLFWLYIRMLEVIFRIEFD